MSNKMKEKYQHQHPKEKLPCKKCGYTGKKSTTLQGETKSSVSATEVVDNRIMTFISCIYKCNELFPEVNSQEKYDAKLASYPDNWTSRGTDQRNYLAER